MEVKLRGCFEFLIYGKKFHVKRNVGMTSYGGMKRLIDARGV